MTLSHGQHRCYPPTSPNSTMDDKYMQNGRGSMDVQRFKKCLNNHTPQPPMHHFDHHAHGHSHPQHCNQQYSGNCCGSEKNCCMGSQRKGHLNMRPSSVPPSLSLDKAARYHRHAAGTNIYIVSVNNFYGQSFACQIFNQFKLDLMPITPGAASFLNEIKNQLPTLRKCFWVVYHGTSLRLLFFIHSNSLVQSKLSGQERIRIQFKKDMSTSSLSVKSR